MVQRGYEGDELWDALEAKPSGESAPAGKAAPAPKAPRPSAPAVVAGPSAQLQVSPEEIHLDVPSELPTYAEAELRSRVVRSISPNARKFHLARRNGGYAVPETAEEVNEADLELMEFGQVRLSGSKTTLFEYRALLEKTTGRFAIDLTEAVPGVLEQSAVSSVAQAKFYGVRDLGEGKGTRLVSSYPVYANRDPMPSADFANSLGLVMYDLCAHSLREYAKLK